MLVVPGKVYRHKKTQGLYRVVIHATLEGKGTSVVVYIALSDLTAWVRPVSEFEDGRFEYLGDVIAGVGGGGGSGSGAGEGPLIPVSMAGDAEVEMQTSAIKVLSIQEILSLLWARFRAAVIRLRPRQ